MHIVFVFFVFFPILALFFLSLPLSPRGRVFVGEGALLYERMRPSRDYHVTAHAQYGHVTLHFLSLLDS